MGMKQSTLVREKTKNGICFTILMAMVWSDSILLPFFRAFLMTLPYIWQHVDLLISLVYIVLLCLSLPLAYRELYVKELYITLLIYGVFFLHYVIYPSNEYYYTENWVTVTKEVFPMFLIGICAYRIERERTLKVMYVISLITTVFYACYMVFFHTTDGKTLRAGDMHAAYTLLPHLCLVFAGMFRKANLWNIGAFVIGTVALLFLGNRGSLLFLGIFVIFCILFSGRLKRPVLFLVLTSLVMVALFLFGFLDYLYVFAEENGFSLRIFQKLENGEIADSSGRDKLTERILEYILLYPMMGMGIFSDRRVAGGLYAHNFVLEIIIHYGIIIGVLFLAGIVYLFVVAYLHLRKKKDSIAVDLFTSLLFSCCLKLLLSNSYLMEPYFFFTIGIAYAAVSERNKMRAEDKRKKGSLGRVGIYEG